VTARLIRIGDSLIACASPTTRSLASSGLVLGEQRRIQVEAPPHCIRAGAAWYLIGHRICEVHEQIPVTHSGALHEDARHPAAAELAADREVAAERGLELVAEIDHADPIGEETTRREIARTSACSIDCRGEMVAEDASGARGLQSTGEISAFRRGAVAILSYRVNPFTSKDLRRARLLFAVVVRGIP